MERNGKDQAIAMLLEKQASLRESGTDRLPQRRDFSESEIVLIKAHLGAFPRALEAAGIKPPRDPAHLQMQQEKRIRTKQRRTAAKINRQNAGSIPSRKHEGEEES